MDEWKEDFYQHFTINRLTDKNVMDYIEKLLIIREKAVREEIQKKIEALGDKVNGTNDDSQNAYYLAAKVAQGE